MLLLYSRMISPANNRIGQVNVVILQSDYPNLGGESGDTGNRAGL